MKKKSIFITFFIFITTSLCFSQTIEDNMGCQPVHSKDNFKILEIHTVSKRKIRKVTTYIVERSKSKKVIEMPEKFVKTYFIKASDSDTLWYMIVSQKGETKSKKRILRWKKYEMEVNMLECTGPKDWRPYEVLIDGAYIPWPRNGWAGRIYVTPNLQGLYYVKPEQKDAINSE